MKLLETEFTQSGFTLVQVKRINNIAIYKRNKKDYPPHFEVIIIKSHNGFSLAGQTFPPAEFYPTASHFGRTGFCCATLERAEEVFNKLFNEA